MIFGVFFTFLHKANSENEPQAGCKTYTLIKKLKIVMLFSSVCFDNLIEF